MIDLFNRPSRFAPMLAAIGLLVTTFSAQAFDVHPIVAGQAQHDWLNSDFGFFMNRKYLRVSAGEGGKAGFFVDNFPMAEFQVVDYSGPNKQYLQRAIFVEYKDKDGSEKNTVVRLYFKPHHGRDEIVKIEVPLSKFHRISARNNGFQTAGISLKEFWGDRSGVANLKRASVVLEKPGEIELSDMRICYINVTCELDDAKKLTLDAKGADAI
jgi:hypothetical protein